MFKYYYFLQISCHVLGCDMVLDGEVIEGSFEELCEKFHGSFENKKVIRIILSKIEIVHCSFREYSLLLYMFYVYDNIWLVFEKRIFFSPPNFDSLLIYSTSRNFLTNFEQVSFLLISNMTKKLIKTTYPCLLQI